MQARFYFKCCAIAKTVNIDPHPPTVSPSPVESVKDKITRERIILELQIPDITFL